MELNSKHLWQMVDTAQAEGVPSWVARSILNDARALEEEVAALREFRTELLHSIKGHLRENAKLREQVSTLHTVAGKVAESGGDSLTMMAKDWIAESKRLRSLQPSPKVRRAIRYLLNDAAQMDYDDDNAIDLDDVSFWLALWDAQETQEAPHAR